MKAAFAAAAVLGVASVGAVALVVSRPQATPPVTPLPAASASLKPPAATAEPKQLPELAWHRQPLEAPDGGPGSMFAATAGGPGMVAVGSALDTSHHHNTPTTERHHQEAVVWTSLDGAALWNRVDDGPGFEHAAIQDVAWSGGVLVAVGYDDSDPAGTTSTRIWRSLDGATWSVVPGDAIPGPVRLTRVVGGAEGFLASGVEQVSGGADRGAIWRSGDGLAWEPVARPGQFERARVDGIYPVESGWVAVGRTLEVSYVDFQILWRSADGERWERLPLAEAGFWPGLVGIAAIISGGPGFIAVGEVVDSVSPVDPVESRAGLPTDGAVWTSSDLLTWTRVEPARELFGGLEDQSIRAIEPVAGGYVALGSWGSSAAAWSSEDGLRWRRLVVDPATFDQGVMDDAVVANGVLVAVGSAADGRPAIWTARATGDVALSPDAQQGIEYPIAIYTHCGLEGSRIDFDGSFWDALGVTSDGQGNPPPGFDNPFDPGTITLLSEGQAEYLSSQRERLRLIRHEGPRTFRPCA